MRYVLLILLGLAACVAIGYAIDAPRPICVPGPSWSVLAPFPAFAPKPKFRPPLAPTVTVEVEPESDSISSNCSDGNCGGSGRRRSIFTFWRK